MIKIDASSLAVLRPGDVMFARHVSPRSVDRGILLGQVMLGQAGYPHHVAVVTEQMNPPYGLIGYPKIVQAMPRGAEEIEIGREHWTSDYTYLRPVYRTYEETVAEAARRYVGTPYSFADYVALAGWHFGVRNGLVRRYVTASKHMICSQLVDQALSDAGFHVFDDGRLPQDVTPSDLYGKLAAMPGTQVIQPGRR